MSYLSRKQRGRYATNACTNCRRKHAKCSGEAICTNCESYRLTCIYVKTGKKRRSKAANKSANVFEDNSSEASNIEQEHSSTQFNIPIPFNLDNNYNKEFQPIQNGFFSKINTNMFDNSGKTPNIEQEHSSIQFNVPIPFYPNYNYNEEFQPIQNGFFSNINANDMMLNNNVLVNFFGNTFSLPNRLSTCSSSIASNLDYLS
ncbi:27929_t:CDS:1, partial [Racocetra persica]